MRRLVLAALCGIACAGTPAADPAPAVLAPVIRGPAAMIETDPRPKLPTRLRIIGTNDFHGALDARPDTAGTLRGGAAQVAAAIRAAEAGCRQPDCVTILLDGGDMFQGTAASNYVFGRPVVDIYNYLGYSAAALGNHEFDWGQDTLRALMKAAHFPVLGANVRYKDGRDVPWIPNDTIVRRGSLAVGIIGVATVQTPTVTAVENVSDLTFPDPVPIIDSIAPILRSRGANIVIVIGHIGGRCNANNECSGEAIDIANKVTAKIDAVVGGHSHTRVNATPKGIPVVQARSSGMAIDVVDLFLDGAPPRQEIREIYTDSIAADADVKRIVADAKSYLDKIAPQVNRPIVEVATTIRSGGNPNALGNLIADAQRVVGRGDIGIMNNGGIRQPILAGTATYGSLFEVHPFGNKLMRVRVRGSDLRAYFARAFERGTPNFQLSGARIVYHAGATPGVDTITIQGRPLADQSVYTVVLTDFLANGGDRLGFGAAAISTVPAEITDLDALITYLKSLPQPVRPPTDQRLIRRP